MVRVLWAIGTNTVRQTIRQRLFYNIAVFGVGMLLLSMVVGQLTFGYADRVVRSIGLSGVSLALNLIALLTSVGIIHQEIDKKTLFVVLARPVRRWHYVVGRYLGLVTTVAFALVGLSIVYAVTLLLVQGSLRATDVTALLGALPEAAILAGIGVCLSAFSTPTLSAGIGLGLWVASTATDDLVRLTEKATDATRILAKIAYYVLPCLSRFNFREVAIYNKAVPLEEFVSALLYGSLYASALVLLAGVILSRREMV